MHDFFSYEICFKNRNRIMKSKFPEFSLLSFFWKVNIFIGAVQCLGKSAKTFWNLQTFQGFLLRRDVSRLLVSKD